MHNRSMQPNVIIVGAGPAGLMSAIEIKLRDPEKNILVLEKHLIYQRKHSVLLDRDSFQNTHPNIDFQHLIRSLPAKIRINELENKLLDFAKNIGIEISYNAVTDCQQLIDDYPDTPIVIGADGSHSIIQQQIFNHEYKFYDDLQFMAEIKYEVSGKAKPLNSFEKLAATHFSYHYSSEFIGELSNGTTPVAIRFFINQETYEAMKEATFKTPYTLAQKDKIDHALLESINAWLIAREEMGNEDKIQQSERITTTHLPCYASRDFVKEKFNKTWFLVGDSAIGMPYFRGLGNGIEASIMLAKAIHAKYHNLNLDYYTSSLKLQPSVSPFIFYQQYMRKFAEGEKNVAHIKNLGLQSLKGSAYVSQSMPVADSINLSSDTVNYKMRMREERPRPQSQASALSIFKGSAVSNDKMSEEKNNNESTTETPTQKKFSSNCQLV